MKPVPSCATLQTKFDQIFDQKYLDLVETLKRYVQACSARILSEIGAFKGAPERTNATVLAKRLGVSPRQRCAFAWLLEAAASAGYFHQTTDGDELLFQAQHSPQVNELASLLQATLDTKAAGTSVPLIESVTEQYPAVLLGKRAGPLVLLKGPGLDLWHAYFSADNPVYDAHNQALSLGVRHVLSNQGETDRPIKILEIGAGTGGSTCSALEALSDFPHLRPVYSVSDIAPSFLLGLVDRLGQDTPVLRRRLDINQPFHRQGTEPESFDLVVATNALHNAVSPAQTLLEVNRTLKTNGALIVSESLCPPLRQVHQELIFNLLPGPEAAQLENGRSPSRFADAPAWQVQFEASPLQTSVVCNSNGPELGLLAIASKV